MHSGRIESTWALFDLQGRHWNRADPTHLRSEESHRRKAVRQGRPSTIQMVQAMDVNENCGDYQVGLSRCQDNQGYSGCRGLVVYAQSAAIRPGGRRFPPT